MRPRILLLLLAAACGSPTIEAHAALAVVNLSPTDGSIDVPPNSVQAVCFSAEVSADDATEKRFWVADASGTKADALLVGVSSDDAHCVKVGHTPLAAGQRFALHIEPGV